MRDDFLDTEKFEALYRASEVIRKALLAYHDPTFGGVPPEVIEYVNTFIYPLDVKIVKKDK